MAGRINSDGYLLQIKYPVPGHWFRGYISFGANDYSSISAKSEILGGPETSFHYSWVS